jgi:hypothetical protein
MRLFTVPVRTRSPSKSRDEISVRGEGCDTPSVTVATIVSKQYHPMQFQVWFVL